MFEKNFSSKYFKILIIFFFLLVYFPKVFTWFSESEGLVFNGAFLNITDFNVYLSAIRQGAEGKWLFQPQFNPVSISPYFAFFPYILSGKLMAVFGGQPILWFDILKFFSLILALANLLSLIRTIFPKQVQQQKTAFFIILFSSGLGWLMITAITEMTRLTPDLFVPEWNLVNGAFAAPHFLLGIAYQAYFFESLLNFHIAPGWNQTAQIALAGIGLSLSYPYLILVDGFVLAAYFIFLSITDRKIHWDSMIKTGTASIPMVVTLIYYGLILPRDPLYRQLIVSNNEIAPPSLTGFLIGFGLLLPLAALGMQKFWGNKSLRIIPIWLASNLIMVYLPFGFSGRLMTGLIIPLTLLAASGIEEAFLPWLRSKLDRKTTALRNYLFFLLIPSTLLFILHQTMVINTYHIYPFYQTQAELDAASWLAEVTTDDDLLLADFPISNLFPRFGKGRVFNGHFDLTEDMEGKFELTEKFWSGETSDAWRQEFVEQWGITYIYQGQYENAHAEPNRIILPYEVIYQNGDSRIYRVP